MVIYSILAGNIFYPLGSKFVYIQKIIITKKVNGQNPYFYVQALTLQSGPNSNRM